MAGKLSSSDPFPNVERIILAEFDIYKGQIISAQYPQHEGELDEKEMSSLLLADGCHNLKNQQEDITLLFLHGNTPQDLTICSRDTQGQEKQHFYYCFNIMKQKMFQFEERGARVKSLAIITRKKLIFNAKPLISHALDNIFNIFEAASQESLSRANSNTNSPGDEILSPNDSKISNSKKSPILDEFQIEKCKKDVMEIIENLYNTLNHIELDQIIQKNEKMAFEELVVTRFHLLSHVLQNQDQFCHKTKVSFMGKEFELNFPHVLFPYELPDQFIPHKFSLLTVFQIFREKIFILLNALLLNKRIIVCSNQAGISVSFVIALVHLFPCLFQEKEMIRNFVPYCSLGSFFSNFPSLDNVNTTYSNLNSSNSAYVIGVSNPIFKMRKDTWDVFIDLNSAKIEISERNLLEYQPQSAINTFNNLANSIFQMPNGEDMLPLSNLSNSVQKGMSWMISKVQKKDEIGQIPGWKPTHDAVPATNSSVDPDSDILGNKKQPQHQLFDLAKSSKKETVFLQHLVRKLDSAFVSEKAFKKPTKIDPAELKKDKKPKTSSKKIQTPEKNDKIDQKEPESHPISGLDVKESIIRSFFLDIASEILNTCLYGSVQDETVMMTGWASRNDIEDSVFSSGKANSLDDAADFEKIQSMKEYEDEFETSNSKLNSSKYLTKKTRNNFDIVDENLVDDEKDSGNFLGGVFNKGFSYAAEKLNVKSMPNLFFFQMGNFNGLQKFASFPEYWTSISEKKMIHEKIKKFKDNHPWFLDYRKSVSDNLIKLDFQMGQALRKLMASFTFFSLSDMKSLNLASKESQKKDLWFFDNDIELLLTLQKILKMISKSQDSIVQLLAFLPKSLSMENQFLHSPYSNALFFGIPANNQPESSSEKQKNLLDFEDNPSTSNSNPVIDEFGFHTEALMPFFILQFHENEAVRFCAAHLIKEIDTNPLGHVMCSKYFKNFFFSLQYSSLTKDSN